VLAIMNNPNIPPIYACGRMKDQTHKKGCFFGVSNVLAIINCPNILELLYSCGSV
jgi:hypothetical protein